MKHKKIRLIVSNLQCDKTLPQKHQNDYLIRAVFLFGNSIFIFFLMLLSGCARANAVDVSDSGISSSPTDAPMSTSAGINSEDAVQATMTPTSTSTPTPTSAVLVYDEGSAVLNYSYDINDEYLNSHADKRFNLRIWMDNESDAVIRGDPVIVTGTQETEVAGLSGGAICWLTTKHIAEYEIRGLFSPETCSFKINIITNRQSSEIVSDTCGGAQFIANSIDGFFHPPPAGPHVFTEDLEPVVLKLDEGVEVRFELEDVQVPWHTGCTW